MPDGRFSATWARWAAVAAVVVCASTARGDGAARTVALGPVRSNVRVGGIEGVLRKALQREVGHNDGLRLVPRRRARLLVRATVTRFGEREDGSTGCEVSLIFEDARTGAIRMLLSGRAAARGPAAARLALEGAVRGALRPLSRRAVAMR